MKMASVRVAVRVRPVNQREIDLKSKFIISMEGKTTTVTNSKVPEHSIGDAGRERLKQFTYDYSYWTVDRKSQKYVSQEQVFQDLGMDVVKNAYEGYNACVFAYGQTGSGKTYTMMGNPGDEGLIPRSCQELFRQMKDESMTYRTEVSYLEIYNEKVRDLLKHTTGKVQHSLRVREHPKDGPYVQDLSKHIVMNYSDIKELMDRGNQNRTTASTCMNDTSSRSHAIFTIVFTQAKFSKECPLETHSKIHLVDLAGSERADATGATGQRLKEGGSINKSLVTLGNVISTLADLSGKSSRRNAFIPYRDSVLTWLLKDSIGGNAKTIMIATISPADVNYAETLSTLRYANRAKDIINKPTVNEDPNVKLIRELRTEIARLNALLGGHIDSITTPKVKEKLHENEARIKVLTQEWTGKWTEVANILEEEKSLALRKEGLGVVLDSQLPHLIGIDDDLLSTGIMLYHLKEGMTCVGSNRDENKPDIVLAGPDIDTEHCSFLFENGEVTLIPNSEAPCSVNGNRVAEPIKLSQGAVILLGQTNMFRFNHPAQAAKLREEYKGSGPGLSLSRISLSQSMTDLCRSTESLALATSGWEFDSKHTELLEQLEQKRQEVEDLEEKYRQAEAARVAEQEEKEQQLEESRTKVQQLQNQLQTATGQDGSFIEEKSKLKSLIEEELGKLLQAETQKIQEAQLQKETLAKDLSELQQTYESNKAQLEKELEEIKERKQEIIQAQSDLNSEVDEVKEQLEGKQKQLDKSKEEISSLEILRKGPGEFDKLSSSLSEDIHQALELENKQLCTAQASLKKKEKEVCSQYKQQLEELEKQKQLTLKDVATEREQLLADQVYINECEDRLVETLATGDKEAYNREKTAIEKEKQRIKEEEEKLNTIESEIDNVMGEDRKKIEEEHSKDIEKLNIDRDKVKRLFKEWEALVDVQLEVSTKNCDTARKEVNDSTEQLEQLLLKRVSKQAQLQQEDTKLTGELNICEGKINTNTGKHEQECSQLEESHRVKQQASDVFLQGVQGKKDVLNSMDVDSIENETELRRAWVKVKCTCMESPDSSLQQLELKIQELTELEKRLEMTQLDFDERNAQLDTDRQTEGDVLEKERFALQELEEQERINSLVEQEIKRRLFEERVEREKQRRMEREREKAERERELNKIKKSHQKELSRLKEKIESSGGVIENTPTRANPYASVMSGDATPTSSVSGLRKTKSVSRTNLARAQSSTSLNPPTKPVSLSIPGFVQRGSGFDTHIEFEVKITVLEETWSVFRRYSKFRELHNDLRNKFPEVGALVFPPKKWFGNNSEKVAIERRVLLENYLSYVIDILQTEPSYPLHPSHTRVYSKQVLCDFHHFFRKGIFESSRHGTG